MSFIHHGHGPFSGLLTGGSVKPPSRVVLCVVVAGEILVLVLFNTSPRQHSMMKKYMLCYANFSCMYLSTTW